jgi:uncharacterized membrane protein YqjE
MTQSPVGQPPRPAGIHSAHVHTEVEGHDPPLKDVLVELWQNIEKLLRQELALASAELDLKAQRLKREAAAFGAGAGLILAGLFALVATIILLLSSVMPAWVAALVTSAATTGVGFALLQKRPSAGELTPERTLQNIKKDVQIFTEVRNDRAQ